MASNKEQYSTKLYEIFRSENFKEIINFPPSFGELGGDGQRILLHFQGMAFAALGAPQKAKLTLLKALNYGENLQILRDLACTYYQLEEVQAWRETYQKLHRLLQEHTKELSFDTRFTSSVTLAKFFEEEGRLGQALSTYEKLMLHSSVNSSPRYFNLLAPQLLRLKSQLPANEELSHLYTQLLSNNQSISSEYINIEIEHSLMLAELNLIGPNHAWARVEKILKDKNSQTYDKRLFYIDFLEEATLREAKFSEEQLNNKYYDYQELSKYEKLVHKICTTEQPDKLDTDLSCIAREIPLGSYLKLLNLYSSRTANKALGEELKNKINLIVSGFNPEDRAFWIKRTQQFAKDSFTELTLDSEKRHLNFQKKSLDVSRKKQALHLLKLLADKPQWSIDEAIESIWNSSFTPEHYNRLRMSVHRTNQLLQTLTTREKCIEISGESLNLHPSVKLKRTMEASLPQ